MKVELRGVVLAGLDRRLGALTSARASAERPARGWLRAVRDAINVGQADVARKLGVTRQAYAQMEDAEARGAISVASLQRAAEALQCEVFYFILPRETVARTYRELAQIHDPSFKHLKATEHSMALEGQAVGDLSNINPPT